MTATQAAQSGAAQAGAAQTGDASAGLGGSAGISWASALRRGALGALVAVFIALSGIPVALDGRTVVEPLLSLGYLALLVVPLVTAYAAVHRRGPAAASAAGNARDLLAGGLAGLLATGGLAVLGVLMSAFDIREPLVHWSPQTAQLLAFGLGNAAEAQHPAVAVVLGGALVWLGVGLAAGVAVSVGLAAPRVTQRAAIWSAIAVVAVALTEQLLTDILQGFKLEFVSDWLYARRGGLTLPSAVVLVLLSSVAAWLATSSAARSWFRGLGRRRRAVEAADESDAGSTDLSHTTERVPDAATGSAAGTSAGPGTAKPRGRNLRTNVTLLAVGALLVTVPPFFVGKFTNELLANVGLFVLLGLGLNIVVGMAGMLDLGYVAFFAIGGYTTAVLTSPLSPGFSPELPWVAALAVVVVMAAIAGVLIGAPVMRLRGDYLAIVTLGFGEIIRLLALSDWLKGFLGGSQGITRIPSADLGVVEVKGSDPRSVFLLVAFFCAIALYASWRLERSRIGRAWAAIREDETVAETMGVDTVATKLTAFVVGAVFASFAGAISVAKVGSVFPHSFRVLVSIVILVVVIVGGMGSIAGVVVGSALLIGVLGGPGQPGLLAEFAEYKLLLYGAALVWVMLRRPEGLVPNVRRSAELHADDLGQDAWLRRAQTDGDKP